MSKDERLALVRDAFKFGLEYGWRGRDAFDSFDEMCARADELWETRSERSGR